MEELGKQILFWVFASLITIEVSPIKLNPVKWVANYLMSDINDKIDKVDKKVDNIEAEIKEEIKKVDDKQDRFEMNRIRNEVLDFANSCKRKKKHTKEQFDHIIEINDDYEELIEKHGIKNGKFKADFNYVLELYHNLLETDDFL